LLAREAIGAFDDILGWRLLDVDEEFEVKIRERDGARQRKDFASSEPP